MPSNGLALIPINCEPRLSREPYLPWFPEVRLASRFSEPTVPTKPFSTGNRLEIVNAWRHRDITSSVERVLQHFRRLQLKSHQITGDQRFGCQLMDRVAEQGFHLQRINNNAPAKHDDVYESAAANPRTGPKPLSPLPC